MTPFPHNPDPAPHRRARGVHDSDAGIACGIFNAIQSSAMDNATLEVA